MKICFLYPPQSLNAGQYLKRIGEHFSKDAQILPSLGLAYLAASLREKGFDISFIDANALGLDEEEIIKELKKSEPDYILYTTLTDNFQRTLGWIKKVRQRYNRPVIIGGPHMMFFPLETLTYECIDYGVIGDGFETLPELLSTLKNGTDLSLVKGICFRNEKKIIVTEPRLQNISLEDVPFPARDLLPLHKYDTVLTKEKPIGTIISALGCPFRCAYCCTDTNLRSRSAEHIIAEVEECIKKYGIKEITFYDETFTVSRQRVLRFLDLIEEKDLKFSWIVRTRADCVDKALLERMAHLGCIEIRIGIESGEEKILKSLNRHIPFSTIRNVVNWSKQAGITVFGFFMMGLPREDKQCLESTLKFMLELDLDFVEINKFFPTPNSKIYEEIKKNTGKDFWRDYTLGKVDFEDFEPYQRHLTEKELNSFIAKSYRAFYYRPKYILKRLRSIRSWKELHKLTSAALALR